MLTSEEQQLQIEADMHYLPEHFAELVAAAKPPTYFEPPRGWGLYAWFLRGATHLGGYQAGHRGLIYIGRSTDLSRRDVKQHLTDGGTPSSTLRRSLGALLKDSLSLTALPRGKRPWVKKDFTHYVFSTDGEQRLTAWMYDYLTVGAAIRDDPEFYEPLLIKHNRPLLNLKGWPNPEAPAIRALRKRCTEEACALVA